MRNHALTIISLALLSGLIVQHCHYHSVARALVSEQCHSENLTHQLFESEKENELIGRELAKKNLELLRARSPGIKGWCLEPEPVETKKPTFNAFSVHITQ